MTTYKPGVFVSLRGVFGLLPYQDVAALHAGFFPEYESEGVFRVFDYNVCEYELDEKTIVKIPREEIERYMKLDGVKTEDDACWIWCEDNGKIDNDEQNELDKKAKENRITATIHQARAEPKARKKVERKADETKDSLVEQLADYLKTLEMENVAITKIGKLIEFDLKGEHYKLDLIRQRKPKV